MNKPREKSQIKSHDHAWLQISELVYSRLFKIPIDERKKLSLVWTERKTRVGDIGVTYRFINYLSQTGLLSDTREENGVGWRSFSFLDCVYINLIHTLRKIGVKSKTLKYLFNTFSQPISEKNIEDLNVDWFNILLCVHHGIEMEVIIKVGEDKPYIIDPDMMQLTGEQATEGQIRISMSSIINKILEREGLTPIEIKRSIAVPLLSSAPMNISELDIILSVRMLKNKEECLRIRKTEDGRIIIDQTQLEDTNSKLIQGLSKLLKENDIGDYSKIEAITRQGGVANAKLGTTRIHNKRRAEP